MAYSWDNRVDFIVRFMYDIDNNGFLDINDFQCMALRAVVIEGKGVIEPARLAEYQQLMRNLWEEISDIADLDRDGKITTDEFKEAVRSTCVGKKYSEFPQAMKAFIDAFFKVIDINGDGVVGIEEYRYNCITRIAIDDITIVDEAFQKLLNDEDKRKGGLTLTRFQELYSHFLGDPDDKNNGKYLFGPILN